MQGLHRIPQDRIAVLIGAGGETRKMLQKAAGCKRLGVDSESGEVSVFWGEPGSFDPVKAMKLPHVIKAIGRGMAPKKALKLLDDENFFTLVDLKDFVSKRTNQQRRVRGRIIGSKGKIRRLIESHTGCEVTVYGSTVVIVGDEIGLPLAQDAVERIAGGSEHGSVIKGLERERKRARLAGKTIDYIQAQDDFDDDGFEALVPGFADLSRRLNRRLKASQIDPEDEEGVAQALELGEDESISWEEE